MKTLFFKYWDYLRSSFWFLPALMVTGAAALAFSAVAFDEHVTVKSLKAWGWVYSGGAEGASAVLQTIASSMVSITGVVFSMTLVALTLASSQFGPRLLRNFMRDTVNQVVLGTFISTFLYCLLVLRTIRRAEESLFIPHVSVTLGLVFALTSICVLIYFIHHVAISIQVDEIVVRVSDELMRGIDRLFPTEIGEPKKSEGANPASVEFQPDAAMVFGRENGYLQFIDASAVLALAIEEDVVIRIERQPGGYMTAGASVALVWPAEKVNEEFSGRLLTAFVFGKQRTPAQDIEFPLHELVEIAVRALSPGINDPFTAITCIDRLGTAVATLSERPMPSPLRSDERGKLRVIAPTPSFGRLTDEAFNQIRQNSRNSCAVTIRLLETIAVIARRCSTAEYRSVLQRHADMIIRGAREALPEPEDRLSAEDRYALVANLTRSGAASKLG